MIFFILILMVIIIFAIAQYFETKSYEVEVEHLCLAKSELRAEVGFLNSELTLPDHKRMEISELELDKLRRGWTASQKRVKFQAEEIRRLQSMVRSKVELK